MGMIGGCLCGAVRYSAGTPPLATRICWCRVCQYFAAGNGSLNVVFPSAQVTIGRAGSEYLDSLGAVLGDDRCAAALLSRTATASADQVLR